MYVEERILHADCVKSANTLFHINAPMYIIQNQGKYIIPTPAAHVYGYFTWLLNW